jgi:phosphoribosylformylglycinamidine synthase
MSEHFLLPGPPALSGLRRDRLLQRLKAIDSRVDAVEASHVFLVWAERPLSEAEHTRLRALLDSPPQPARSAATLVWVVPRLGTVSPWASKATDIARNCGMPFIRRIERGVRYGLSLGTGLLGGLLGGARAPDEARLRALGALLHDRMTETLLLAEPAPADIFQPVPGRPMQRIAVGAQGRAARANQLARYLLYAFKSGQKMAPTPCV